MSSPIRIALVVAAAATVTAAVVAGLGQREQSSKPGKGPNLAEIQRRLKGAPAPLKELHRQSGKLLETDEERFSAQLKSLKGYPVVINKWASWCGPCRLEFPFFQRQSAQLGRRVAFIGLNSRDDSDAARRFLNELPVGYPSYSDPNGEISQLIGAGENFPVTVMYNREGEREFVHQGGYLNERQLAEEIRRYLLDGKQ